MRLNNLVKRLFIKIPDTLKNQFDIDIAETNLIRVKLTSTALLLIESIIIVLFITNRKSNLSQYPNSAYLGMYILMIIAMSLFLLFFNIAGKDIKKNYNKINISGISFGIFVLIWCGAISLLDQHSSGQIIVYATSILAIAIFPLLKPNVLLFIYIFVHTLFLVFLPYFQSSSDLLFGNYINSSYNVIIGWVISGVLYRNKINELYNKYIIQKQNKELNDKNKELELINQKLEKLSFTDSLTGLLNRRKFDEELNREWETCKRYLIPITLIMIDIDYFKRFNDIYGHQVGDDCIIKVANVLSNTVRRASDIVARYGGEEFIIALPHIEKEKAYNFSEQIRKNIEALQIQHEDSYVKEYVTVSLGVCTVIPSDEITVCDFIKTADNALYKAKFDRNMTVSSEI
jgi:diguanylate cyclase (GGDEF)-like protein